ncbi:hypothetical protein BaRGS_00036211 [Batillaria attramentaria]|uniref:Uncharacterized protein n=1 Tax=Batillaria attramentaria TaxID=370345 RepID=A0ABD0JC40_9CAEN
MWRCVLHTADNSSLLSHLHVALCPYIQQITAALLSTSPCGAVSLHTADNSSLLSHLHQITAASCHISMWRCVLHTADNSSLLSHLHVALDSETQPPVTSPCGALDSETQPPVTSPCGARLGNAASCHISMWR